MYIIFLELKKGRYLKMKIIKTILEIIAITFAITCAFGGGCFYWIAITMIFNFNPTVNEIGFYISSLVGVFIGFWLAPKLSDKIFK